MKAIKEKPILFSGEMVRAILAGRKTQTRRIVKDQTDPFYTEGSTGRVDIDGDWMWSRNRIPQAAVKNRFGKPGEGKLWVKETWKPHCEGPISDEYPLGTCVKHRADGALMKPTLWTVDQGGWCEAHKEDTKWHPSIFMPRWASRITLEIVDVRIERLKDISEADAKAEGTTYIQSVDHGSTALASYRILWEQINGKGSWAVNPWVWVVTFSNAELRHSADSAASQPKKTNNEH